MEAIALVPTIERLLLQGSSKKKQEGIALIWDHIGVIGSLLSNALPLLKPEEMPEAAEDIHLLSSMIYFYTQRYTECVEQAILSDSAWFVASERHHPSLGLYFKESKNRVLGTYTAQIGSGVEEQLKQFVLKLAGKEEKGNYSLLGLFISTKDHQAIESFLSANRGVLSDDTTLMFIVEGAMREKFYPQLLQTISSVWEGERLESYSQSFFRALCDSYIVTKNEEKLISLLSYLGEKRKEVCLGLAFIVHDKSPILAQKVSSQIKDAQTYSLLKGRFQSEMYQKFLTDKIQTSFALLTDLSKAQSSKLSMNHMALSFCNSIMNCRTANDTYLRKNLEWMRQAKNWSKFVVAASFGCIHSDNEDPFEVLRHYLPQASTKDGEKDDPESGGSLLALGLICLNTPTIADSFLSSFLDAELEGRRSYILHGACLALGLSRLGTGDESTVERFKNILYSDTVIASEAAAYSIGLVGAGHFDAGLASEILTYARGTEHEKISRSVSVGVALTCIGAASSGASEGLSSLLEEMLGDMSPIVRYAGVLSLGSSYVGTGDLSIARRLLSVISTDTSEDVKKGAVFAVGLVLSSQREASHFTGGKAKTSELCKILEPLAQSHSPYVRSGVALTLGMFLAGTGCVKALELIEVLMYDTFPWVRQHASIGAGFLLMQLNVRDDPFYKRIVNHMHGMTRKKSESGAARFGALLGRSIIDACGRNGIFSIYGMSGDLSTRSLCGAILFSQYWYWYPLVPFITLGMRPSLLLAVDTNLNLVEDFSVEIDGPEKPYLITTLLPAEGKKSHKRFKTMPLSTDKKPEEEVPEEKPSQAQEEEAVEEKFHLVKNFSRLTMEQKKRSPLAGSPSVLFFAAHQAPQAPEPSHQAPEPSQAPEAPQNQQ
ncbi:26S proteasome regulatory subunit N2 [Nematocida displodere]|uniref:26S proteasome regulatory subunit N2 n=1 Tax=Nematocida displodere TaxID=1805483 RepID=A0A177EES5_9MICR|nr:26S proteasome regulatory subunit N2 [Nematocida displodere]